MKKNKVLLFSFVLMITVAMAVGYKEWKRGRVTNGKWVEKEINGFCVNDVCVEKGAGEWLVKEAGVEIPAETEMIEATTTRLKDIVLDEIVSENEERFGDLGIGEEVVVMLQINERKLELGSISQKYDGTYVRPEGLGVVYKVGVILDKNSWSQTEYWRKKVLTNLAKLQIKKITIEKGEKKREISEDEELSGLVSYIELGRYLVGFELGEEKYHFTVETEGESKEFLLGQKMEDGENVYWASESGKHFFEIDKELFDSLTAYID